MPARPSATLSDVPPIAIIVSRYNQTVTDHLRQGAIEAYVAAGGDAERLTIIEAPGTYELPILCDEAAAQERHAGVVALGCVIRGETDHDRYIAQAVAGALQEVALDAGIPVGFGVLTCNTVAQAVARSGGKTGTGPDNKGRDAMRAVLGTIAAQRALRAGAKGTGGIRFSLPEAPADKGVSSRPARAGSGRRTSATRPARGARRAGD